MMFITTMPPTTSEMKVIGMTTAAMPPVRESTSPATSPVFTSPKSSSSFPFSLCLFLKDVRASSMAVWNCSIEAALP